MKILPRPLVLPFRLALLMFGILTATLSAQPRVEIASPTDNELVSSGKTLTVVVKATGGTFDLVGLLVETPLVSRETLAKPPYRFSITVPNTIPSGRYAITALGSVVSGQGYKSEPISVQIERPDSPERLNVTPSILGFDGIDDSGHLRLYGLFADGSKIDLTHSSLTRYVSDDPRVAVADDQGMVTAKGSGSTRIRISNAGRTVSVPVTVPSRKLAN